MEALADELFVLQKEHYSHQMLLLSWRKELKHTKVEKVMSEVTDGVS
jgi:hypothetical protein